MISPIGFGVGSPSLRTTLTTFQSRSAGCLASSWVITVAARPDAPMFDFGILIDGSHRAALALRDGRDFFACLLTEQEQRSICTYTVEGKVTAIPQIAAGPGITPEDAGL